MKIGSATNLITTLPIKENKEPDNILFQRDKIDENCAVQLSISKIGREYLNQSSNITVEELEKQRDYIENMTMDSYMRSSFLEGYNKLRQQKGTITEQDMVQYFSETYQKLYQEIMDGYQNGTRTKYVQDDTSESGYRKLTMEEELQDLDRTYDDMAQFAKETSTSKEHILTCLERANRKIASITDDDSMLWETLQNIERWQRGKVVGDIIDVFMNQRIYIKHSYATMI